MVIRHLTWDGISKNDELNGLKLSAIRPLHSGVLRRLMFVGLSRTSKYREMKHLDFENEELNAPEERHRLVTWLTVSCNLRSLPKSDPRPDLGSMRPP